MSTGLVTRHDADQFDEKHVGADHADAANPKVLANTAFMKDAFDGENEEHEQGWWEAAKTHPKACFWAFIMCFTIVMESFDMFLNGNFVAQRAFQKRYGIPVGGEYVIETKWQSALFQAGQCGAFVGVFLAGPVVNRFGYRLT
ncbi:hypothetical protein LZ30DRAFT_557997, partial [Colletotrichum cereale]